MFGRNFLAFFIAATLLALVGCSSDDPGASLCGDGQDETVQGVRLCIYGHPVVIETGFE